jgi:hypothetical protein
MAIVDWETPLPGPLPYPDANPHDATNWKIDGEECCLEKPAGMLQNSEQDYWQNNWDEWWQDGGQDSRRNEGWALQGIQRLIRAFWAIGLLVSERTALDQND